MDVMDYSIVARFRPGAVFEIEYLREPEQPVANADAWCVERGRAHQFYTHGDAHRWAVSPDHEWLAPDGRRHRGWAEVLSKAEAVPRREELPRVTQPPRERDVRRGVRAGHVEPAEAFEILEKRHLA